MIIRIFGAILVVLGCSSVGFVLAATHKRTTKLIRQLISALEYMEYELQYRQLALPELFSRASTESGEIKNFFHILSAELEGQTVPDVEYCVAAALGKVKNIPDPIQKIILRFGQSTGHFDLESQIKGLTSIRKECELLLKNHIKNQDNRLRSYQTLALCAGTALVVILI